MPFSLKTMHAGHPRLFWAGGALLLLLALGIALFACIALSPCPHPMEGLSFSRMVLDRTGKAMRIGLTPDQKYRIRTRLEDIPPEAQASVIRYEDKHFWRHPGVNVFSIARSVWGMLAGGRVMGGSTITMQVARLALGLKTGSIKDKIRQIWHALKLERHFTKAQILEAYFNLAPYGGNVEGLGAAAWVYFHKPPAELTPLESTALMLVPQNPAVRQPSSANRHFFDASARLLKAWYGTRETAPLRVYGTRDLPFACPHLAGELLLAKDLPDMVATPIDPAQQELLERALRRFARRNGPRGLANAAAMLVHWPTMEVRALAGSADFASTAISGQIDGTLTRRSPGSTLKPFIYALALEQGLIHPMTLLKDLPRSFAGYDPENFDYQFRGPLPAGEALRLSRNVPALSLAARLKNPDLYDFLKRCHVAFAFSKEHFGLSLVLGGAEVTMRELAACYCMLANKGVWQPLRLWNAPGTEPLREQRLSPEASFVVLRMLESPASEASLRTKGQGRIPALFKTGTSNGYRDAWTAGIFGPYVLVVWVGNFDNAAHPLLIGATAAKPLFLEIARGLAQRERLADRLSQPSRGLNVEKVEVCTDTGDLETSLCQHKTTTWFIPGVSPIRPTGIYRTIRISAETGLRACEETRGPVKEIPWQFWPSDLDLAFRRAGIAKPDPPPFGPECLRETAEQDRLRQEGQPPQIVLPKYGITYHVSRVPGKTRAVPLKAHATHGVKTLYWFAGSAFIGTSAPEEVLLYQASPGRTVLRCTDDAGRSSARQLAVELEE